MFLRDGRLFIKCLAAVLITGCIFLAICAGAVKLLSASENGGGNVLTLVLVNEDSSYFGDFALSMISANENIRSAVQVVTAATESEAIRAVEEGADGALILPDDFFASVNTGENYPIRIILNDSVLSAADTIRTFSRLGSDMLSSAQLAVYEGDLYLRETGVSDETRSEYNILLNSRMAGEIVDAPGRYFEVRDLRYTDAGLSVTAHYISVYLVFFFGIISMAFFHLYRDDCEKNRLIRLFAAGIGKSRFVIWKILLPALVEAAILAVICAAAGSLTDLSLTLPAIILAACAVLFAASFGACIGIAFGDSAAAILFVLFFIGLFFCGGIIPYSGLSAAALTIGRFTPSGVITSFLSPLFGGSISTLSILMAVVYLFAGFFLVNRTLDQTVLGKETV